ncbi:hypothetical protein EV363DRAFT_1392561 [Boletus edulis]|nr:hypothetical protein EV363DRAFT_1392561 [Boletus edulis]
MTYFRRLARHSIWRTLEKLRSSYRFLSAMNKFRDVMGEKAPGSETPFPSEPQDAAAPQPAEQKIGIAIPLTKRSGLVNADGTANKDALEAEVEALKAIRQVFDNYEKNTGRKHPSDMRGVERRGAGDPLTWTDEGQPAKPITVDFDTVSSNNHGQSISLPHDGATVSGEQHTDTVSNLSGVGFMGMDSDCRVGKH